MLEELNARPYDSLSVDERIVATTSSALIKYLKGVEAANMLDEQNASRLIGSVKKLASVALLALGSHKPGNEEHAGKPIEK